MEHVEWEFKPRTANVERGVLRLEFALQQMYTALMALTSSRKRSIEVWRRHQKRYDRTTRERERNLLSHDHFSWTKLSVGTSNW